MPFLTYFSGFQDAVVFGDFRKNKPKAAEKYEDNPNFGGFASFLGFFGFLGG